MNKNAPEIRSLRQDIERNVNRHIRTPYDFEFLTAEVQTRLHEHISPTTLKRLWGYISGADTTRRSTLCLLAQFLGYADWEAYLASLAASSDVESETFAGEGIRSSELQAGQLIEVTGFLTAVVSSATKETTPTPSLRRITPSSTPVTDSRQPLLSSASPCTSIASSTTMNLQPPM